MHSSHAWVMRPTAARQPRYDERMPECRECKDEVDEVFSFKQGKRSIKVCEDCRDRLQEEADIAEESESVIQGMMGFKGRR